MQLLMEMVQDTGDTAVAPRKVVIQPKLMKRESSMKGKG